MDVAGGQQLDEPVVGHVAGEAHVGQAGGPLLELGPGRAVAVDQERHVGQPPGRLDEQVERLREADVAGVQHDRLVADAELARGTPSCRSAGRIAVGVDEVGDRVHGRRPVPAGSLAATLAREVVGQHGDGVGEAVADPLQPRRGGDHAAVR